jgi:hypothetical protein
MLAWHNLVLVLASACDIYIYKSGRTDGPLPKLDLLLLTSVEMMLTTCHWSAVAARHQRLAAPVLSDDSCLLPRRAQLICFPWAAAQSVTRMSVLLCLQLDTAGKLAWPSVTHDKHWRSTPLLCRHMQLV